MYEAFYGLSEPPFRLTPDPHYLYLSTHHREALGHLLVRDPRGHGLHRRHRGHRHRQDDAAARAAARSRGEHARRVHLQPRACPTSSCCRPSTASSRSRPRRRSKKELVDELNRFLVAQKLAGKRVVVIVDEAQNLPPATLEQLRLLSNLETETTKLLQIVLVGQPELKLLLGRPELAQLNQRITVRWHLEPLDRAETARYVLHRLRIAGGPGHGDIFSPAALAAPLPLLGWRAAPDQHRGASRAARRLHARAAHDHRPALMRHVTRGAASRRRGSARTAPRLRRARSVASVVALLLGLFAALALSRVAGPVVARRRDARRGRGRWRRRCERRRRLPARRLEAGAVTPDASPTAGRTPAAQAAETPAADRGGDGARIAAADARACGRRPRRPRRPRKRRHPR